MTISETVRLGAVGDVAISGSVEKTLKDDGNDWLFSQVRSIHRECDLMFCNLESVYSHSSSGRSAQAHLLKCEPERIDSLVDGGFNVVSVANNHIMDYGQSGLDDTLGVLDTRGIHHVGAGRNLAEARKPALVVANGIVFGFLAYAMRGIQSADSARAGTAIIDQDQILDDIKLLKSSAVDHVVVSLHSGMEFMDYPHPDYRTLCRTIAEHGASLILGHHPHVIQAVEMHANCLIVYSMGNYVFDLNIMDYKTEMTAQGMFIQCIYDKSRLLEYRVIPIRINEMFQPTIALGTEKEHIEGRLKEVSKTLLTPEYPKVYFKQASELWPKINISVNWEIIRKQGVVAFLKRIPRIKKIYLVMVMKFFINKMYLMMSRSTK